VVDLQLQKWKGLNFTFITRRLVSHPQTVVGRQTPSWKKKAMTTVTISTSGSTT